MVMTPPVDPFLIIALLTLLAVIGIGGMIVIVRIALPVPPKDDPPDGPPTP